MFSLRQLLDELESSGHLVRMDDEVDPHLEAAEIHRRVYAHGGPAVLYDNVKGCRFPMVSNLFGTLERARYLFRHSYENVRRAIELKIDPGRALRNPLRYAAAPLTAWRMQPRRGSTGPILANHWPIAPAPVLAG
jgi:4-hydroxy-3-polyprenylbenzoate decarboxylase